MNNHVRLTKLIALIYAGTAIGIYHFWWQFFYGGLFPVLELTDLIPNFYAYYVLEKSFCLPDLVLATTMLLTALFFWLDFKFSIAIVLGALCSGAAMFLGALDLNYGIRSGLYLIQHPYIDAILEAAISALAIGFVSAGILIYLATSQSKQK